jgi:hypothetical protein
MPRRAHIGALVHWGGHPIILPSSLFYGKWAGGTSIGISLDRRYSCCCRHDMPRKARLDTPGALHHIVVGGIERRKIFNDDNDRDPFLKRLSAILGESRTPCYAWAIMPNHFHLLLKTGQIPFATLMRRLLSGARPSLPPITLHWLRDLTHKNRSVPTLPCWMGNVSACLPVP